MLTLVVVGTAVVCLPLALVIYLSLHKIGPDQVGLITKRFAWKQLDDDNLIAFAGEAGYQAELLMPGLQFRLWPVYSVDKFPWVQIPAGQMGVVLAQVGAPLPVGAKSGVYKAAFGQFADLDAFMREGGQKGVQRPVLPPGTTLPLHPVAFLVLTRDRMYGLRVGSAEKGLLPTGLHLRPEDFEVKIIRRSAEAGDQIGIVTTLEGNPLPAGDIASRIGGFDEVGRLEAQGSGDQDIIEAILGTKNESHNNYQDFQAFLDQGGRIGLQHDPLL